MSSCPGVARSQPTIPIAPVFESKVKPMIGQTKPLSTLDAPELEWRVQGKLKVVFKIVVDRCERRPRR